MVLCGDESGGLVVANTCGNPIASGSDLNEAPHAVETLPANLETPTKGISFEPETRWTASLMICSFAPEWIVLPFDLQKLRKRLALIRR